MAEHAVQKYMYINKKKKSERKRRRSRWRREMSGEPRQTAVSRGHGAVCSEAVENRLREVFRVNGPVGMSTLCSFSPRASSLGVLHLLAGPIRNVNRPVTSETRLME